MPSVQGIWYIGSPETRCRLCRGYRDPAAGTKYPAQTYIGSPGTRCRLCRGYRDPAAGLTETRYRTRGKVPLFGVQEHQTLISTRKMPLKNTAKHEVFGPDRIGVSPTPFSAILLLQAAHARNTPPPCAAWSRVARGGRVAGRQAAWWRGGGLVAGGMVAGRHGGAVAW